tara:strand:- start:394 stop:717 length:324 start_codon:yes stop_codon:yes gene_type:complete
MSSLKFSKGIYLVITTELDIENAYKMAGILLRAKLIACVTFKNVESHFWWEGEINQSKEVQLIMKCRNEKLKEVCKKIQENHTYEVPEVIYLPVSVNKTYYEWVLSL